jgi:hypothetical protein
LSVVGRGHHHDGRRRRLGTAILLDKLATAHHRHLHVEQDEIGRGSLDRRQRLAAVVRNLDTMAVFLEQLGFERGEVRVVLDYQNLQ